MVANPPANLADRLPAEFDPEDALEVFLDWTMDQDLELYPAQEEAILEVMAGRHVILATPTGSGKSLVALAQHFRTLARGERGFYTSPIKALVSEKFFALCRDLGADNVGMLTGDAAINRDAPIICCTAEVLANIALRHGAAAPVDHVVMDEFHYYADRDRGMAWQLPLLLLPDATFLLMSATLGDTSAIERGLRELSGREVALVRSDERPVPLTFEWRDSPIQETVTDLLEADRAPIYLVNTSQRAAAEQAQNLMSVTICSREQKREIAVALGGFRFDSPYGRELERFVRHGIGLHHAGLLPRYRLLVERLAQQGLLKVISGTDTLGVGINIPLRTVLLTALCKYDGEKTRIISNREFHQITGRAGRKGFDDKGGVCAQAPEHVIENRRLAAKAGASNKGGKFVRRKPPQRGYVPWNEDTFQRLVAGQPEALESVFRLDHGLLLAMLQRDAGANAGLRALVRLIGDCHERPAVKQHLRRELARLFRSLVTAGVVELWPLQDGQRGREVSLRPGLQRDFSLHHSLSLFLVEALDELEVDTDEHALRVITLVEAILENPRAVLMAQVHKAKGELIGRLKAEGVEYDERMVELEKVTWPKPDAEWIYAVYNRFSDRQPWLVEEAIRPKSVVRDLLERECTFYDYVQELGLQRMEGVLLRYVSQVYKTLIQNVPESVQDEVLVGVIAELRAMLARVDSSLVQQWEQLREGKATDAESLAALPTLRVDLARNRRHLYARLRAEVHALVRALARGDLDEAAASVWQGGPDPWPAERFAEALQPFVEQWGAPRFDHRARLADKTTISELGERRWSVVQRLVDGEEEADWCVEAVVDLGADGADPDGPLLGIRRIGA